MAVIKHNYNQFILLKNDEENNKENRELDENIEYIKKIINGGKNRNRYNNKHRSNKKIEINSNIGKWRLKKTVIKKKIDTEKDKFIYEINSLLNKMSPKNYDKILKQIIIYFDKDLEIQEDLIKSIIDNVFIKAVTQPVYCALYVKFIKYLNDKYDIHPLLDRKCSEYKNILEAEVFTEDNMNDYDRFCEENKTKIFKVGYSQFIGELYNNHLIKEDVITDNIRGFINNFKIIIVKEEKDINTIESIIICLSKLLITTYNNIKNRNFSIKDMYSHRECLSKRLQFKIEDINEFVNKK